MIATPDQASGRTKRSQAMRLSDIANSTAPAAARTIPEASADATMTEITIM